MKYKMYTLVFALILCTEIISASGYYIGDFYYYLNEDEKTAVLSFSTNYYSYTNADIPETIVNNNEIYKVTKIADGAFADCSSLQSVHISKNIESIGNKAFVNSGLKEIYIPNNVKSVGGSAFANCPLEKVYWGVTKQEDYEAPIPQYSTSIYVMLDASNLKWDKIYLYAWNKDGTLCGEWPGMDIELYSGRYYVEFYAETPFNIIWNNGTDQTVDIKNVSQSTMYTLTSNEGKSIGYTTSWFDFRHFVTPFSGSTNSLTEFVFGDSVEYIPDYLCYKMDKLQNITVPNSVINIGDCAFKNCSGIISANIGNGVVNVGNEAFANDSNMTNITIGNNVINIGREAFYYCSRFSSMTIPNSVTSIGSDAFYYCTGLNSINIPNSVTKIGSGVFTCCTSLTTIIIPNSVTKILDYTFYKCTDLTSITIGNSVTNIGEYAFYGCSNLASLDIPNSVTNIDERAFGCCSGLTSVSIGRGVTCLGYESFKDCSNMKSLSLGESIVTYRGKAFSGCNSLTSIYNYRERPAKLGTNIFADVDYFNCTLYVLAGSVDMYKSSGSDWKDFYFVKPIGAASIITEDIQITPSENTAKIIWPEVSGAATYELVIKDKSGNVICTLNFNAQGKLTSIAFSAPARGEALQQTQDAGFSFTVTGLEQGTGYDMTMTAKNNSGGVLKTKTISFYTNGAQGIEEVQENKSQSNKLLRDGQIFIIRDGKIYTLQGQEVK